MPELHQRLVQGAMVTWPRVLQRDTPGDRRESISGGYTPSFTPYGDRIQKHPMEHFRPGNDVIFSDRLVRHLLKKHLI